MRAAAVIFFACGLAAHAAGAEIAATSNIDSVIVFPSGAGITRAAKVKVEQGDHTIVFGDLPGDAAPESIRIEGRATGGLEIGSVDHRRLAVPRAEAPATDADRKRIEDEIENLRDGRTALEGEVQAAETQKTLITNLTQLPVRPAPQGGASGAPPEDWRQILALIAAGSADANRAALDARAKIRETDLRIAELEKKLGEIAPKTEERTEVKVYVSAAAPLEADLLVRYQVPNASWKPFYDARLTTGDKAAAPRLQLTRRAAVSQRTGEAWTNVLLALSTSRPSAGASAPELYPITVDFPPEPRPVAAFDTSKLRTRQEAPAGEIARDAAEAELESTDGLGAVGRPAPAMAKAKEKDADVTNAPFQAVFAVPGRVTVPATGEEKRVQLQEDGIDPTLVVRTVPKRDAKAYLYAKFEMPKTSPLLAGPVSLFRDGTFAGTGQLPILVAGEKHELGFGVDDLVRVRHALIEEKRGETGLISSSKTDERNFRITLSNQHERAIEALVIDQIPASQNEAIKVEITGRPAPAKKDWEERRGVVAWELKLDPGREEAIDFGYRATWPGSKTVVYGP